MTGNVSDIQRSRKAYFQLYKYIAPIVIETCLIGCVGLVFLLVRHRKTTRYPATTNLAICCLLLADSLFLIAANVQYLGKAKIIPYRVRDINENFCNGILITLAVSVYCQCYLQCIISVERFVAVKWPLKVKLWITKRRMVAALILCAAISITVAYFAMPVGFRYKNHTCEINPENGFYMALLAVFTVTTVPGLILTVCTVGIISGLVSSKRNCCHEGAVSGRLKPSEVRLALMLVVMDIVFILMGIPYTAFTFMVWIVGEITPAVKLAWDLSLLFTSLGAFTDWIVIFALGSQVRRALKGCVRSSSRGASSQTSEQRQLVEIRRRAAT